MVGVGVEVMEMNLKLIHREQMPPPNFRANEGLDRAEIEDLLKELEKLGVSWEVIETSRMSDDDLLKLYSEAIVPAVQKKYPIRKIFGTNRNSRVNFGKGVPALLVYEPGSDYPVDVYPHGTGRNIVTIRTFLESLIQQLKRPPMAAKSQAGNMVLVERMDRLREKIGPIGVPVVNLIREGRRR